MLASTHLGRERILSYGATGTGKSHDILNIALWSQRTHSPSHFYILDSDNSILDMVEEEFSTLTNTTVFSTVDYLDYRQNLDKVYDTVAPDDWVCVDFLGTYWSAVQNYFTEEIFGKDIDNFFLQARKELEQFNSSRSRTVKERKKSETFDGWKDWTVMNKMNDQFMKQLCLLQKCHVFCTSRATPLIGEESKDILDVYHRWGLKPEGQKYIGHYFRTIILKQKDGRDYRANTVKDKGRGGRELEGTVVKDFTLAYLKSVAGWRL